MTKPSGRGSPAVTPSRKGFTSKTAWARAGPVFDRARPPPKAASMDRRERASVVIENPRTGARLYRRDVTDFPAVSASDGAPHAALGVRRRGDVPTGRQPCGSASVRRTVVG